MRYDEIYSEFHAPSSNIMHYSTLFKFIIEKLLEISIVIYNGISSIISSEVANVHNRKFECSLIEEYQDNEHLKKKNLLHQF